MIQHGTIRDVSGDRILVGCGPAGGCKNCSSSFCAGEHESLFEAANPAHLELCRGDRVELYLAPGKTIIAGFMVLILPLILFAAGYLLASRSGASEVASAVFGLVGLGLGFLLGVVRRRTRGANEAPVIRSILRAGLIQQQSG